MIFSRLHTLQFKAFPEQAMIDTIFIIKIAKTGEPLFSQLLAAEFTHFKYCISHSSLYQNS